MNRILLAAAVLMATPAWFAGGPERGNVYAFFARGDSFGEQSSPLTGGGIGGELFVWKGLAAAADVSWYRERVRPVSSTIGMAAIGGAYHFVTPNNKRGFDPFVTGGISRFFEAGPCGPTCDNRAGISGQGGGG